MEDFEVDHVKRWDLGALVLVDERAVFNVKRVYISWFATNLVGFGSKLVIGKNLVIARFIPTFEYKPL